MGNMENARLTIGPVRYAANRCWRRHCPAARARSAWPGAFAVAAVVQRLFIGLRRAGAGSREHVDNGFLDLAV